MFSLGQAVWEDALGEPSTATADRRKHSHVSRASQTSYRENGRLRSSCEIEVPQHEIRPVDATIGSLTVGQRSPECGAVVDELSSPEAPVATHHDVICLKNCTGGSYVLE